MNKVYGRKKPYTQIGVKRLPCARCGEKAEYSWSICADGNLFRPICLKCDIELNRMVLEWIKDPDIEKKMEKYVRQKSSSVVK